MVSSLSYQVNFDFEYQLFDKNYSRERYSKFNREWEFLYWFSGEKSPLLSQRSYDADYLKKVEKITRNKPSFSQDKESLYWNGEVTSLAKILNSRRTSAEFAIKNKFAHETTQINKMGETNQDYLIKYEGGLSGRNIKKNHHPNQDFFIFEKHLERVFDFSILFVGERKYCYQNIVNDKFQYKGSRILSANKFQSQMLNFLSGYDLFDKYFDNSVEKIFNFYEELASGNGVWNIDGFIFLEKDVPKLYLMSEVNYRKTMGYCFIMFLENIWKESFQKAEFLINPLKEDLTKNYIKLSPEGNLFNLYFHWQ